MGEARECLLIQQLLQEATQHNNFNNKVSDCFASLAMTGSKIPLVSPFTKGGEINSGFQLPYQVRVHPERFTVNGTSFAGMTIVGKRE
jgi:hypothetical protein